MAREPRFRFVEFDSDTLSRQFSEPSELGVRIPDLGRDASD
jgi:hypothetical protein